MLECKIQTPPNSHSKWSQTTPLRNSIITI